MKNIVLRILLSIFLVFVSLPVLQVNAEDETGILIDTESSETGTDSNAEEEINALIEAIQNGKLDEYLSKKVLERSEELLEPVMSWLAENDVPILAGTEIPLNFQSDNEQSAIKLNWESSDPSVISIEEGTLKAHKPGLATITVKTNNNLSAKSTIRVLFRDVINPIMSYYEPVYWAVDNGITTGKKPTRFMPFDYCTRAHFVTFLWRQQGCPEPTISNPFKDVEEGKSFTKAIIWAYEKGITTGTSDTEFSPFKDVTRGQVATFLYRAAGKPAVTGTYSFRDVPSGKSYTEPIIWMVEKDITTGKTPYLFDPNGKCTRGQTVTFLNRTYAQ